MDAVPAAGEGARTAARVVLVVGFVGSISCFLVGLALVVGYYSPDAGVLYTTRLTPTVLAHTLSVATVSGVADVLEWPDYLFLASAPAALLVALLPSSPYWRRSLQVALCCQFLFLWLGWLGLLSLPYDLYQLLAGSQDGEWLGEHWPLAQAMGLWLVACLVAAAALSQSKNVSRAA